uniref:TLC domain-containing protein n=1 Tax=Strombidium rassoulzadegani TaxID=1082188 RepID=A0A7S3CQB2_9SPIT|mmetsp:Transcript_2791/g.4774  ORF Transcript_2791/g.4774 Transcript_2791/m.4774 type:complete len:162 (+) Transcript_2791:570-1055(+)
MMQTYAHHIMGMVGALIGSYLGGFLGSISQLTWVTEFSTPSVNLRAIMAMHKATDNALYVLNGLMMTLSFFVFRVVYYRYMIFWKIHDMATYRSETFWATYPAEKHALCLFCIVVYFIMFCLQLFWFSKIVMGLFKAFGLDKAVQLTERAVREEPSKVKKE